MKIDFPNSPNVGDTVTYEKHTWEWTGTVWRILKDVPNYRLQNLSDVTLTNQLVGDVLVSGNTGFYNQPRKPAFGARTSVNSDWPYWTWSKSAFNTLWFEYGTTGQYSTSNRRYTIPVKGVWNFSVNIMAAHRSYQNSSHEGKIAIYLNGSRYRQLHLDVDGEYYVQSPDRSLPHKWGFIQMELDVGDYVEIWGYGTITGYYKGYDMSPSNTDTFWVGALDHETN